MKIIINMEEIQINKNFYLKINLYLYLYLFYKLKN